MRLPWLTLALTSLALGGSACSSSHHPATTTSDAGPGGSTRDSGSGGAADAGASCRALPGVVNEISCELGAGSVGLVRLQTMPTLCCASGAPTATARADGASDFTVEVAWTACDCCEGCRCIGPTQEATVSLGALAPGVHVVRAGGVFCTLTVPGPTSCVPATADEARFPRVLYPDQEFSATVVSDRSLGCSCDPRVASPTNLSLELCSCCFECDCVDSGYEANIVSAPLAPGGHLITIPHGAADVQVVARESCHPLEPTGLRIVQGDATRRIGGPRLVWAVVSSAEYLCCAAPAPAVDLVRGPPIAGFTLELSSCVQADCECLPGAPTTFEAWHSLGELPPGDHVVRAGSFVQTVHVE